MNDKDKTNYKKAAKNIQSDGRKKGLTGSALQKRKNKHWNTAIKATVWAYVIILAILGIFSCLVIGLYTISLYKDPAYLRTVVENSVLVFLASLATLGIKTVYNAFTFD